MKDPMTFQGTVEKETDKAILFRVKDKQPVWLPKSQVEYDADTGAVIMPKWLANTKELEE
jgi:hypothetical protein